MLIDRESIAQAILNLLNNAIKYSSEVKRIEIKVQQSGCQLVIEIADHGIGIPRAEQSKIFDKFYRVTTGMVHDTKGSGLGLALVKHIIKAHRGEVIVNSASGKGSRFTILLPIGEPEEDITIQALGRDESSARGYSIAENPHH